MACPEQSLGCLPRQHNYFHRLLVPLWTHPWPCEKLRDEKGLDFLFFLAEAASFSSYSSSQFAGLASKCIILQFHDCCTVATHKLNSSFHFRKGLHQDQSYVLCNVRRTSYSSLTSFVQSSNCADSGGGPRTSNILTTQLPVFVVMKSTSVKHARRQCQQTSWCH